MDRIIDLIEVLHETTTGSYMVYSHNDGCTYQMRRGDIESQASAQLVEVLWGENYA